LIERITNYVAKEKFFKRNEKTKKVNINLLLVDNNMNLILVPLKIFT